MKVLLIGGGGREHAIGWKLAQSPRLDRLISLPGNPGLASLGKTIPEASPLDTGQVVATAADEGVDLVVIGPEAPLARGLVDDLTSRGIPAFGPTRASARIESSKWFAKQVMQKAGIPTASARLCEDRAEAISALNDVKSPYVVKADGLAGGKGVLVTDELHSAIAWVDRCLAGGFGEAGRRVLIEEHLAGPELSVFAVCSATEAVALAPARDYKRLRDGDEGPNTGGMGSYSPVSLEEGLLDSTMDDIVLPALRVLAEDDIPYRGFLYVGLVLTEEGPKVLEFNVRLGDPEAQAILPRMQNDLVDVVEACMEGTLAGLAASWTDETAVNVVLAAAGYPEDPQQGMIITGVQEAETVPGALVFHAGTSREGAVLTTAGGRVLSVVGMGETAATARATSYRAASHISWPGMQYRGDIGGVGG